MLPNSRRLGPHDVAVSSYWKMPYYIAFDLNGSCSRLPKERGRRGFASGSAGKR